MYQQALLENKFPKLMLTNRFRFEERFLQDVEGVLLRTRYQIKGIYPLGKKKIWGLVFYDEIFVNLNSRTDGPQAGIDQNRLFAGLSYKFSDNVRLETGYQLQYINSHAPKDDKLNHIVLISLYYTLPQLFNN